MSVGGQRRIGGIRRSGFKLMIGGQQTQTRKMFTVQRYAVARLAITRYYVAKSNLTIRGPGVLQPSESPEIQVLVHPNLSQNPCNDEQEGESQAMQRSTRETKPNQLKKDQHKGNCRGAG